MHVTPDPAAPPLTPACRCCGSADVTLWGQKPGRIKPVTFSYFLCRTCGFRFVEPVTPPDVYNDDYYNGVGADPYVDYVGEMAPGSPRELEYRDLERLLARFRLPVENDVRWLDYGCGTGTLLRYFDSRQISTAGGKATVHVEGCDVGSFAARLIQDGYRIHGYDSLEQVPPGSFDVISLIEVIEHIPEPATTLALLSRLLKPGGLLILTTGNLSSPAARWGGLSYRYLIPEIHISLFSPGSLSALYRAQGLEPVGVRYSGVVRYKVMRSLLSPTRRRWAAAALRLPTLTRLIDCAYGVSAMPWAQKPR
jgi:SAM-dependent methyltransferase